MNQYAVNVRNKGLVCAAEGCSEAAVTRELCRRHYSAAYRKAAVRVRDPLVGARRRIALDVDFPLGPSALARELGVSRQRAHQLMNREQVRARQAVERALAKGRLIKPKLCARCQKQTRALEAHHWDYRARLDVRWLCKACHCATHATDRRENGDQVERRKEPAGSR